MKLREFAKKYYEMDYNCAESILLAANEKYALGIPPEEITLIGGFGGGMASGMTCGALTGGIAAIGKKMIETRAHVTEGLKDVVAGYVQQFKETMGSAECSVLKEKYHTEEGGCIEAVLRGADVLEEIVQQRFH